MTLNLFIFRLTLTGDACPSRKGNVLNNRVTRLAVLQALCISGLVWVFFTHSGMAAEVSLRARSDGAGPAKRTILRVWDWWSPGTDEKYATYFRTVKREFEALHPDVEVVFQYIPFQSYEQKMATGLVGSSPPDVFQSSVYWAEGFYDRGMLLPLNGFLDRERRERERRRAAGLPVDTGQIVDKEALLDSAWRHNTKPDGTVFGIPQLLDSACLVWNLDILEKAAARDPEIEAMYVRNPDGTRNRNRLRFDCIKDWDQFRRVLKKLTRFDSEGHLLLDAHGDFVQAGYAIHAHGSGAEPFLPWFAANGTNFQDVAGTRALFADKAGVEATQLMLDLYWTDHVSPPFRRQLSDDEVFNQGKVACASNGTWAGKYIVRNTEGKLRFDLTPFPPGPHGRGQSTLTWGNMLVITRRTAHPDLAWEYVKFITSRPGSLRMLHILDWNSARKDFYEAPDWRETCEKKSYQTNVPAIAACGQKLRNTQINAVNYASQSTFETLLLHYPQIQNRQEPYSSVQSGLESAAKAVDRVYDRYNAQVAQWQETGQGAAR